MAAADQLLAVTGRTSLGQNYQAWRSCSALQQVCLWGPAATPSVGGVDGLSVAIMILGVISSRVFVAVKGSRPEHHLELIVRRTKLDVRCHRILTCALANATLWGTKNS